MMKKLLGVNNNELLKEALDEAKAICEEDVDSNSVKVDWNYNKRFYPNPK